MLAAWPAGRPSRWWSSHARLQSAGALRGALHEANPELGRHTGYPDQLAGDDIPLGSQIVFVCDAYSAMNGDRCYQAARSPADARAELRRNAGTQFAPAVVDAFLAARPAPVATAA